MIRGAIFDVDGVLIDSMILWLDLGGRYLRSIDVEPEEGLMEILFSMSMEQGAQYLKDHYKLKKSIPDILNGINKMTEDFYFNEVEAKPGARELLEFLDGCGIKMVAATSSPREHVEKALIRNGLHKYIEKIYTNSEIGVSKHEPDIYNIAAGYLETEPSQTLVFEDSLYALKTAAAAGYVTVGVYDANGERDQEGLKTSADLYLTSLTDLHKVEGLI